MSYILIGGVSHTETSLAQMIDPSDDARPLRIGPVIVVALGLLLAIAGMLAPSEGTSEGDCGRQSGSRSQICLRSPRLPPLPGLVRSSLSWFDRGSAAEGRSRTIFTVTRSRNDARALSRH